MIYLEKNDIHCTLTTYIYCHMWMLWVAELEGKDAYINWPNDPRLHLKDLSDKQEFQEQPNMFEWYFVQPKTNEVPDRTETRTWETWVDNSGTGGLYAQPLKSSR